jgi:regulator of RNase E activity RraA
MRAYEISIQEMSERYRALYTGAIGDILDKRGFRMQILPHYINQMTGNIKIAGPAFTGYGEEITEGSENDSGTRVEMLDHIEPHTISVWQTNGHELSAHWGEIMSNAAVQRGCTGAVLDGGVRDLDFILKMKFPVYCRFSCSASSIGRWSIRKYQVPITIGRTTINPGDFIIGDIDGVVVVPQDLAYEVLIEAESLKNQENLMRGALSEGSTVKAMYEKYGTF